MDVKFCSAMCAQCRFPCRCLSRLGLIVITGTQSRFGRQREALPDRTIERPCIAAGKFSTSSAIVWHEQSVADERSVADNVGQTRWRVARGMQYRDVE